MLDSHPKDFLVGTRLPSGAEKALALNPGGIGFFRGTRFAAIDRSNLHINWDDRFFRFDSCRNWFRSRVTRRRRGTVEAERKAVI